jgi:hypothetical protein
MVNYQLGKIYKIVGNGLTYYGSTCEPTLARRLSGHVEKHKSYKNGKYNKKITSFDIIELGDYKIVLIENFACDTKDELHARERYYIETNECLNKVIPGRTRIQYRDQRKEFINEQAQIYRDTHKELIKKQYKKYSDTHRELTKERCKKYRDTHKEELREKASIKVNCECGGKYTIYRKSVHLKTKKHLAYITQESVM